MATPAHPPTITLHRIHAIDDLDATVASAQAEKRVLLVHLGSEACTRCPDFGREVADLATQFQFTWYYAEAADSDLPEHFGIAHLPAFVLYTPTADEPLIKSAAAPVHVRAAIEKSCAPVLVLDAEF